MFLVRTCIEAQNAGLTVLRPEEVSAGNRLVGTIHAQCVVGGRAAKVFAPALLRVVGKGAGIDQNFIAANRKGERQSSASP